MWGKKLIFENGRYKNKAISKGYGPGINLIGYVYGEFGIGEHLRYAARSCAAANIPFSLYNYDKTLHRQEDKSLERWVDSTQSTSNKHLFA